MSDSVWLINSYLDCFGVGLDKQVEKSATEVVSVTVWIAQLISDCVQEQISSFVIQINCQVLENVHVRAVNDCRHVRYVIFRSEMKC